MPERNSAPRGAALILVLAAAACGGDTGAAPPAWTARTDTAGDTISVHTLSGSLLGGPVDLVEELRIGALEGEDHEMFGSVSALAVGADGDIYVLDRQVPALRRYAADGTFLLTMGRKGGGPGEYASPDGGLAVLRDGRVVVRDPGNARFTVYLPDGTYDASWLGRGGFNTSRALYVDTAGDVYSMTIRDAAAGEKVTPGSLWINRLVRLRPDGSPADTIDVPVYRYDAPTIMAQRTAPGGGISTSMNNVPFSANFFWAFSPHGYFVTGIGDRYAVDLHRSGGVLRIGRDAQPVPVSPGEKAEAEERATRNMRSMDPDWKWNGPPIPDRKPVFNGLFVAQDARIWVRLSVPAETIEVPPDEVAAARAANRPVPSRFREPVVFDVFEPDGRHVGQVRAPRGFSLDPQPVARGDHVWAVFRDELDVPYVVRYRIGTGVQ
jgi:hypothetical protein